MSVERNAKVISSRRLVGGVGPPIHALIVRDNRGRQHDLVLRHWRPHPDWRGAAAEQVRTEAQMLERLAATDLPVPKLVASDPTGKQTGGVSAVLMTRVPGRINLNPKDPDRWLGQMAAVLPEIHAADIKAPDYRSWLDLETLEVPVWSENPRAWEHAIELARGKQPSGERCFIHRDFQHFNMLWQRGKLTGLVDWRDASIGSPNIDVAHCRLNLAVLFSADWAERFRIAYEAEAGSAVDPWWDAVGLLTYLPGWESSLQLQVGRQKRIDRVGMNRRVEVLLEIALSRL